MAKKIQGLEAVFAKNEYMKQRKRVQNLIYSLNKKSDQKLTAQNLLGKVPKIPTQADFDRLNSIRSQAQIMEEIHQQETPESPDDFLPSEYQIEYVNFMNQFEDLPDELNAFINEFVSTAIDESSLETFMDAVTYAEDEEGLEPPSVYGYNNDENLALIGDYFLKLISLLEFENMDNYLEFQRKAADLFDEYIEDWRTWED